MEIRNNYSIPSLLHACSWVSFVGSMDSLMELVLRENIILWTQIRKKLEKLLIFIMVLLKNAAAELISLVLNSHRMPLLTINCSFCRLLFSWISFSIWLERRGVVFIFLCF